MINRANNQSAIWRRSLEAKPSIRSPEDGEERKALLIAVSQWKSSLALSESDSSPLHRCFPVSHMLKILGVTISDKLSVIIYSTSSAPVRSLSRYQNPAHPRHAPACQVPGRRRYSFSKSCRRQTDVRSQRLVGLYYGKLIGSECRQSSTGVCVLVCAV